MDNAQQIFEAAEAASRSGETASNFTILIQPGGGIHMIADSDWPLDRIQQHNGAEMAYRVGESNGKVVVEGHAGSRHCRLESESPNSVARQLLGGPCWITPAAPQNFAALPPAQVSYR